MNDIIDGLTEEDLRKLYHIHTKKNIYRSSDDSDSDEAEASRSYERFKPPLYSLDEIQPNLVIIKNDNDSKEKNWDFNYGNEQGTNSTPLENIAQNLSKYINESYCSICKKTGEGRILGHYKHPIHYKNVLKWLSVELSKFNLYKAESIYLVYCLICNIPLQGNEESRLHYGDETHYKNIPTFCLVCFTVSTNMKDHLADPTHTKLVNANNMKANELDTNQKVLQDLQNLMNSEKCSDKSGFKIQYRPKPESPVLVQTQQGNDISESSVDINERFTTYRLTERIAQELSSLIKANKCLICNKHTEGRNHGHYKHAPHYTEVLNWIKSKLEEHKLTVPDNLEIIFCMDCNLPLNGNSFSRLHYTTNNHIKNSQTFCQPCRKVIPSFMECHILSKKHQQNQIASDSNSTQAILNGASTRKHSKKKEFYFSESEFPTLDYEMPALRPIDEYIFSENDFPPLIPEIIKQKPMENQILKQDLEANNNKQSDTTNKGLNLQGYNTSTRVYTNKWDSLFPEHELPSLIVKNNTQEIPTTSYVNIFHTPTVKPTNEVHSESTKREVCDLVWTTSTDENKRDKILANIRDTLDNAISPSFCFICKKHENGTTPNHYRSTKHVGKINNWIKEELRQQKITVKPNLIYCSTCNLVFMDNNQAQKHYSEVTHKTILKSANHSKAGTLNKTGRANISNRLSSILSTLKDYMQASYCFLCNKYEVDTFFSHYCSAPHGNRVEKYITDRLKYEKISIDICLVYCPVCNEVLDGSEKSLKHYEIQDHLRKLENYCIVCKKKVENLNVHLKTNKHKKNVKQSNTSSEHKTSKNRITKQGVTADVEKQTQASSKGILALCIQLSTFLYSLINPLYCLVCGAVPNKAHLRSEHHIRHVRQSFETAVSKHTEFKDVDVKEVFKLIYCEACNVCLPGNDMSHYDTEEHKSVVYCPTCIKWLNPNDRKSHYLSKKHQNNVLSDTTATRDTSYSKWNTSKKENEHGLGSSSCKEDIKLSHTPVLEKQLPKNRDATVDTTATRDTSDSKCNTSKNENNITIEQGQGSSKEDIKLSDRPVLEKQLPKSRDAQANSTGVTSSIPNSNSKNHESLSQEINAELIKLIDNLYGSKKLPLEVSLALLKEINKAYETNWSKWNVISRLASHPDQKVSRFVDRFHTEILRLEELLKQLNSVPLAMAFVENLTEIIMSENYFDPLNYWTPQKTFMEAREFKEDTDNLQLKLDILYDSMIDKITPAMAFKCLFNYNRHLHLILSNYDLRGIV